MPTQPTEAQQLVATFKASMPAAPAKQSAETLLPILALHISKHYGLCRRSPDKRNVLVAFDTDPACPVFAVAVDDNGTILVNHATGETFAFDYLSDFLDTL